MHDLLRVTLSSTCWSSSSNTGASETNTAPLTSTKNYILQRQNQYHMTGGTIFLPCYCAPRFYHKHPESQQVALWVNFQFGQSGLPSCQRKSKFTNMLPKPIVNCCRLSKLNKQQQGLSQAESCCPKHPDQMSTLRSLRMSEPMDLAREIWIQHQRLGRVHSYEICSVVHEAFVCIKLPGSST